LASGGQASLAFDVVADKADEDAAAGFSVDDIKGLLASEAAGDRAGLAAVEATGDPQAFEPVVAAVEAAHTAFEHYHASQALESLRPGLTDKQREIVTALLNDKKLAAEVSGDPSRPRLVNRLLRGVAEESRES